VVPPHVLVSLGYDKIRIIHPVFIDDTVTARYTVEAVDEEEGRMRWKVEIVNQDGKLCLIGTHVLKWVARVQEVKELAKSCRWAFSLDVSPVTML
jgi:acyl dehydratase